VARALLSPRPYGPRREAHVRHAGVDGAVASPCGRVEQVHVPPRPQGAAVAHCPAAPRVTKNSAQTGSARSGCIGATALQAPPRFRFGVPIAKEEGRRSRRLSVVCTRTPHVRRDGSRSSVRYEQSASWRKRRCASGCARHAQVRGPGQCPLRPELIEWAADQPWSTRSVGLIGVSYPSPRFRRTRATT
jgi:hypothetical protein